MKCPTPDRWVLVLLIMAPLAGHSQDAETVRVAIPRGPVDVVIRVPVKISNFHPTWQGEAISPANGPAGEIRCTLLDAAGNSIGHSPEYLLPAIPEGGSFAKTLEFETSVRHDAADAAVAGYRCSLRSFVGTQSKPLLCATSAAAEGSVCEVSGTLDAP